MGKGESVRPTVGWREWVSLPDIDIDIDRIKGKIDAGARTSALHAVDLQYFDEGVLRTRFRVYPVQRDSTSHLTCDAEVIDERSVKISSGVAEVRPVIRTNLCLGASCWSVDLTLTDRASMGFRLLLGRRALQRRVLVDPSRSFLSLDPT
ncbi:MAG: RimK/LysX family protein [Candidatus Latescibacterota bacterium]|nr:RimK/LysX family protein [Candidatus Latescibacterota bacterium]